MISAITVIQGYFDGDYTLEQVRAVAPNNWRGRFGLAAIEHHDITALGTALADTPYSPQLHDVLLAAAIQCNYEEAAHLVAAAITKPSLMLSRHLQRTTIQSPNVLVNTIYNKLCN